MSGLLNWVCNGIPTRTSHLFIWNDYFLLFSSSEVYNASLMHLALFYTPLVRSLLCFEIILACCFYKWNNNHVNGFTTPQNIYTLLDEHFQLPPYSTIFFEISASNLTGGNWQKWKRVFLTCPCRKIYRDEAVGLKSCKYIILENLRNLWKWEIWGNIAKIWYFASNFLIEARI